MLFTSKFKLAVSRSLGFVQKIGEKSNVYK